MKIRESGMPERDVWESFFDPANLLTTLGLGRQVNDAAEFGCGYGTFTIPAAKLISGKIYALDIEPDMVRLVSERASGEGLGNVRVLLRDFMVQGSGMPDESVDYAMLFNILHLENPIVLLQEAARILKKGGRLAIIHWNHDPATPRGPSLDIRPRPEQCIAWAKRAGFCKPVLYDLSPYHYGIVAIRFNPGNII